MTKKRQRIAGDFVVAGGGAGGSGGGGGGTFCLTEWVSEWEVTGNDSRLAAGAATWDDGLGH